MAELSPRWSVALPRQQIAAIQRAEPDERNVVRFNRELRYFAFLDMAEEEYRQAVPNLPPVADLRMLPTTETDATMEEQRDHDQPELGMVHFDCVQCDYFDTNLPRHQSLYGHAMDGAHPINAPRVPSDLEEAQLRAANRDFDQIGDYNRQPRFLSVYLAFNNTRENWRRFREYFPDEGWYAFELSNIQPGLPVQVLPNRDDGTVWNDFRITTLYSVGDTSLHQLQHVFSLDFAPDLPIPPQIHVPDAPIADMAPMPVSKPLPTALRLQSAGIRKRKIKRLARKHLQRPVRVPVVEVTA